MLLHHRVGVVSARVFAQLPAGSPKVHVRYKPHHTPTRAFCPPAQPPNPGTVHLHVAVDQLDSGVVTKDPNQEWYTLGTPVTLTAEPVGFEPLCEFDQWSGDVPAGHERDNPLSLTMDGYKRVTAHFATSLGDADQDCDLDLPDFAGFQECFGLHPLPPGCEVFDLDSSGVVDWADVELWIEAMTGPSE